MNKRMTFVGRLAMAVVLSVCFHRTAAAENGTVAASNVGVFDVDTLLLDYPLSAGQPMRTDQIARDSLSSMHLTQIRGAIESHRHLTHDENIWVIRGAGRLTIDGVKHKVSAGQVIHIPRGISHAFHNMGSKPTVVISVFSPGFDGKDRIYDNPPPR